MTGYYASVEIENALGNARDLIEAELTDSEKDTDLIGLFMAAFKEALKDPDLTLEAVVKEEHGTRYTADDVRRWWDGWS
ncbi:hypothetical protein ACFY2K_11765 [Kitasatospora sp. NPDC001309]|uniref:hypothetical protein n=1 Tax=Kitasatospora sp. NPDC001309 TaxID=3364013 RepID=UPI003683B2FE